MNTVFFDAAADDSQRRERLYQGQLFVYSPRPSALAFTAFARAYIEDAFGGRDPRKAQYDMSVEDYAALLGKLKPSFIHHPESKRHLTTLLEELGCDLEKTYFDVPKLRSSTSDGYLTTGIAYAWHPHRDTWYSAPPCQLNWWMPIYEIDSTNAMAFHPRYWSEPVLNDSHIYNYYQWNKLHRGAAVAALTKVDTRPLPRPQQEIELEPQLRLICPPGGVIVFSAAQMHSSVPNTSGVTRFSIDFRTVNVDDVAARRGAANIDSACTGTSLRDFLRATDLAHVPDPLVALYDDGSQSDGELVFQHKG